MSRGVLQLPVSGARRMYMFGALGGSGLSTANLLINPDATADFVAKQEYFYAAAGVTVGSYLKQVALNGHQLSAAQSFGNGMNAMSTRDSLNPAGLLLGIPALRLIPAGSQCSLNASLLSGGTFAGNFYWVLEGYRVYANQQDPIPATIQTEANDYELPATISAIAAGTNNTLTFTNPNDGSFIIKGLTVNDQAATKSWYNYLATISDNQMGSIGYSNIPLPLGLWASSPPFVVPWATPLLLGPSQILQIQLNVPSGDGNIGNALQAKLYGTKVWT